jgi:uncharacterized sulfatase
MAAEGVRLDDYHVTSPVCSQSRFGFLTGRYPIRVGLDRVIQPMDHIGIPDWELTIGSVLQPAGYRTACVGKWHLGNLLQYLPVRHGFDYFFGLPHSNDMNPLPLYRNEEVIEESPDQDLLTSRYTDEAIAFMQRSRNNPFFLYLSHTAPHIPLHASAQFRGHSAAGLYGDVVEELDYSTGRVLDAITELGLDDRTLVLFTSDNGPWLEQGADGGSPGPFRGGKFGVFEGGIRVPFIARWPGELRPGQVVHEPASSLDVLPTLAALAHAVLPEDRVLDGEFAWSHWAGLSRPRRRPLYFYTTGALPLGVRMGRWKMHLAGTAPRLYDMTADLGEATDVASLHPAMVQGLTSMIDRWRLRVEAEIRVEAGQ